MLETIKNIIRQKREFLESAELLFGEATDLSNGLVDDEFSGRHIFTSGEPLPNPGPPADPNPDDDNDDGDDSMGSPAGVAAPVHDGDPQGAKTGSMGQDEIDDLLSISINLGSNTVSDTVPVTPNDADSAEEPDLLSAKVPVPAGDDDFTEAINIDGSKGDTASGADDPTNSSSKKGDGVVTQAVIDKVSETEDDPAGSEETLSAPSSDIKDTILDKLDKLQKNILDTKESIKRKFENT